MPRDAAVTNISVARRCRPWFVLVFLLCVLSTSCSSPAPPERGGPSSIPENHDSPAALSGCPDIGPKISEAYKTKVTKPSHDPSFYWAGQTDGDFFCQWDTPERSRNGIGTHFLILIRPIAGPWDDTAIDLQTQVTVPNLGDQNVIVYQDTGRAYLRIPRRAGARSAVSDGESRFPWGCRKGPR